MPIFPTFELPAQIDRNIGGISFDVVTEEEHRDEVVITEHPVEQGSVISDHAYLRPVEVTIRAGSSLSSPGTLSLTGGPGSPDLLTQRTQSFLRDLYQNLIILKDSFQPFNIVTGKRNYQNMLIRVLQVVTDERSENILRVTAWCREVILTTTSTTTFPPNANHQDPSRTGSMTPMGFQQPVANPSFSSTLGG